MTSTVSDAQARAGKRRPEGAPRRAVLDLATLVGLAGVVAVIVSATVLGGSPGSFVNPTSFLIVFGGTFAVTTVCFTWQEVRQAQRMLVKALSHARRDPAEAATEVLELAVLARKKGVLALQRAIPPLEGERFLHKALTMVVDGFPADAVEQVMRSELEGMVSRHDRGVSVLRKAAEVAPVMGLIGTLVGLVQMLGRLDDPSSIGPAMAVALLTTFYGAVLGNMVLAPLASKLERNSGEEATLHNIYLLAAVSIGRQENPRRLEMMLNTVLPPAKRVRLFR